MKRSSYLCSLKLPNNFVSFIREIGYSLIYLDALGTIKKHLYCQLKPFHWSVFKTTPRCTSFIIWSFALDRWSLSRVIPSILACRFKISMSWKREKNKGYNIRELTQAGLLFIWRQQLTTVEPLLKLFAFLCCNTPKEVIFTPSKLINSSFQELSWLALQNIYKICFPRLNGDLKNADCYQS